MKSVTTKEELFYLVTIFIMFGILCIQSDRYEDKLVKQSYSMPPAHSKVTRNGAQLAMFRKNGWFLDRYACFDDRLMLIESTHLAQLNEDGMLLK